MLMVLQQSTAIQKFDILNFSFFEFNITIAFNSKIYNLFTALTIRFNRVLVVEKPRKKTKRALFLSDTVCVIVSSEHTVEYFEQRILCDN